MKNFSLKANDDKKINVYLWDECEQPKGVVHVLHGMAEEASRYDFFAQVLNKAGFVVTAHDHRGHGKACEKLGYIEGDIFAHYINDAITVKEYIKNEFNDKKLILLGHSMGSFIARNLMIHDSFDYDMVVLSGVNSSSKMLINVGAFVASISKIFGGDKPSKVMDSMFFGAFNKQFKPSRTDFDWLSRDEKQVDAYVASKYCGFVFPAQFYREFLLSMKPLCKKEELEKINKDLPVLIIGGEKDSVGNNGEGPQNVYDEYIGLGFKNTKVKIYPQARHEVINETNRDEVIGDIIEFIND